MRTVLVPAAAAVSLRACQNQRSPLEAAFPPHRLWCCLSGRTCRLGHRRGRAIIRIAGSLVQFELRVTLADPSLEVSPGWFEGLRFREGLSRVLVLIQLKQRDTFTQEGFTELIVQCKSSVSVLDLRRSLTPPRLLALTAALY